MSGRTRSVRSRGLPWLLAVLFLPVCGREGVNGPEEAERGDGAVHLSPSVSGSLQNPAWSPDGRHILFTRFRNGYNRGPADILIHTLPAKDIQGRDSSDGQVHFLVRDGSDNVNAPGACWSPVVRAIVFSSSRDPRDEIFRIGENGAPGDERRITDREGKSSYEPTLSPDGLWAVFESHVLDVEGNGVLVKTRMDGTEPVRELTPSQEDCRQPNWSPAGGLIAYQRFENGQWDIWTCGEDGGNRRRVTQGEGDKTDASFSPDGAWIVCSVESPEETGAGLAAFPASGGAPVRITSAGWVDSAPSWSPDGRTVAFESSASDPDGSSGTDLFLIDVTGLFPGR
jgi:TolB protein